MREFDPLTGDPMLMSSSNIPHKGDGIADLCILDKMTREQLIALITTVGGAIWGYALMNDEQKAEAARLKLYNLGMSSNEVQKVVPALDKWFDRTQGKAAQAVKLEVKGEVEHYHNIELSAELLKEQITRILKKQSSLTAPPANA